MAESTSRRGAVRDILGTVTAESTGTLRYSTIGRVLQPARHGGFELGADEFVALVFEAAALDGSLGWVTAMFNAAAHEVAGLPEHAADEVWGTDPHALIATSYRAEEGSLQHGQLTGRWTSVIGAEHADWLLLPAGDCRILLPCRGISIDTVEGQSGLNAAGIGDVTATELPVDERHVFGGRPDRDVTLAGAVAAAAVVGSADGMWREHVDQVRARLATSYGGDEVTNEAAAQVARAASDIDAAKLQVTTALQRRDDAAAAAWAHRQAVARARDAADRLLAISRHALDASDPATRMWKDVYAGSRLMNEIT
jgi:3-hydroxy-9,10-secoandrosta-1,3,5(10)-triene-9,17-dione monooxygenase